MLAQDACIRISADIFCNHGFIQQHCVNEDKRVTMPPNPNSVENQAIDFAISHFKKQGYSVEIVSGKRGHGGYDLTVSKEGQLLKVEVKGCSREWQIPDLYGTEVGSDGQLVADFLAVVYLLSGVDSYICVVPRSDMPPEKFKQKLGYRIHSSLKKESFLGKYRQ